MKSLLLGGRLALKIKARDSVGTSVQLYAPIFPLVHFELDHVTQQRGMSPMNLANSQPRIPRTMIAGLAMAARTANKARAADAGTLGKFKYNCSMDKKLFAFAGIDASDYLSAVTSTQDDHGAEALLLSKISGKSPGDVDRYSGVILESAANPNGGNC